MSKHTPGPWIKIGTDIGSEERGQIATMSIMSLVNMKLSEREANARLIAAAPEMLDALEWIASLKTGGMIEATAKALVAKAKGELS